MTYHPLVNPDRAGATTEQNLAWMEDIRAGETDLINVMIEANIPLVMLKLESFLKLYPGFDHMWDDMVGEGLLALTEAVHDLAKKPTPEDEEDNNPQGFMGMVIVRRVGKMLSAQTRPLPETYRSPLDVVVDPRDSVDTQDMLEAVCETYIDREILDRRMQGSTIKEIGDALDLPREAVSVYLQEIKDRYEQLSGEE